MATGGVGDADDDVKLFEAAEMGDVSTMRGLFGEGAIGETAVMGVTALMVAVANGHSEAAKLLLQYGADVNAVDEDGLSVWDWCGVQSLDQADGEMCRRVITNAGGMTGGMSSPKDQEEVEKSRMAAKAAATKDALVEARVVQEKQALAAFTELDVDGGGTLSLSERSPWRESHSAAGRFTLYG